jgi:hypothetical protein
MTGGLFASEISAWKFQISLARLYGWQPVAGVKRCHENPASLKDFRALLAQGAFERSCPTKKVLCATFHTLPSIRYLPYVTLTQIREDEKLFL